jgi:hypothetical protein
MFRVLFAPIIRSILSLDLATARAGSSHARPSYNPPELARQQHYQAACTVFKNTPDDGCKEHPKHVEYLVEIKTKATSCITLVVLLK